MDEPLKYRTRVDMLLWGSRICFGLVLLWNIQCAAAFLVSPGIFAPGFEVSGTPGDAIMRGYGILFLMWNVPYLVAMWNPRKYRTSVIEAICMQVIGLVGESFLLISLPAGHAMARETIMRFVWFDGIGLALLMFAGWITRKR